MICRAATRHCCHTLLCCLMLAAACSTHADVIQPGEPLSPLAIETPGELVIESGEDVSYRPWSLPGPLGKPHVLQYMAGTLSARGQTKPFNDRLEAEIPHDKIHITTIVNMDQTLWGTTPLVLRKVRANKLQYPLATIVLDEAGLGQATWSLPEKDAAVVIMDANGSVLWFREGALSDADIDETIRLLQQHIE